MTRFQPQEPPGKRGVSNVESVAHFHAAGSSPALLGANPDCLGNGPGLTPGAGETEAISLALECAIPTVLMDERKGQLAAGDRGLIAVGTLNLLDAADEAELLEFDAAMNRLEQTSFRFRPELADYFRETSRKRRRTHEMF